MTQNKKEKAHEEFQRVQAEQQKLLADAQKFAQLSQNALDATPKLQYAAIVAVDLEGAFAKEGKIPWHYPADFKWFQSKTKGHICVMGRTTYNDIVRMQGDKIKSSVLPNRKCFVITSTPLEHDNAIAIKSLSEIEKHLTEQDIATMKVWICGGERLYREAISLCDELYITTVNLTVDGDQFFPTKYTLDHFGVHQIFKNDEAPDLRFTIWKRK